MCCIIWNYTKYMVINIVLQMFWNYLKHLKLTFKTFDYYK